MEMDNEVKGEGNEYSTELRQYDPRLTRWTSYDPLASISPFNSPYSGMGNSPIVLLDEEGAHEYYYTANGELYGFRYSPNDVMHAAFIKDPDGTVVVAGEKFRFDKAFQKPRPLVEGYESPHWAWEFFFGKDDVKVNTPIDDPLFRDPFWGTIRIELLDEGIPGNQAVTQFAAPDITRAKGSVSVIKLIAESGLFKRFRLLFTKSDLVYNVTVGNSGRVESAFAKISKSNLGKGSDPTAAVRRQTRAFGEATDDAGHAIANRLGGPGLLGSHNIFPQSYRVNRGIFREWEADIAAEVAKGKEVFVHVVQFYRGSATRPHAIQYQVRINGVTRTQVFPNTKP